MNGVVAFKMNRSDALADSDPMGNSAMINAGISSLLRGVFSRGIFKMGSIVTTVTIQSGGTSIILLPQNRLNGATVATSEPGGSWRVSLACIRVPL
jgi:hypothetical protein